MTRASAAVKPAAAHENGGAMHTVEMRGVSYAYPEGTELVFHDLTLNLPEGVVALVGQNGTGKSTLMLLAIGITGELHDREQLERAYDVPFDFLKRREACTAKRCAAASTHPIDSRLASH